MECPTSCLFIGHSSSWTLSLGLGYMGNCGLQIPSHKPVLNGPQVVSNIATSAHIPYNPFAKSLHTNPAINQQTASKEAPSRIGNDHVLNN